MAARISDRQLSEAVCSTITDGAYPEDEAVISAELSSGSLEHLSQMLNQAREEVKSSIRELSRLNAEDVDGWITEAKQLRQDLEDSKKQSAEMETLVAQRQELENISVDASHKVNFLKREFAFNDKLIHTLNKILEVRNTVDGAQEALVQMDIYSAMTGVKEAEALLAALEGCQRTAFLNLMRSKIADIRENLARAALLSWQTLVPVNYEAHEIRVRERTGADPKSRIENTISALETLDLLKGRLLQLKKDAETLIFRPRTGKSLGSAQRSIQILGPVIKSTDQRPGSSVEDLLTDISAGFNYFSLIMPTPLAAQFLPLLSPSVVSSLISGPLASAVPPDLGGITMFANTLSVVRNFADTMGKRKWPGGTELIQWVENAPKVWLQHRSNSTLSSIRQLLARGAGKPRSVERVETQQVPIEDKAFQENGEPDDWNASWSDDEDDGDGHTAKATPKKVESAEEEDEAGAWGFDESEEKTGDQEEDESEDWGWGDDNDQDPSTPARNPRGTKKQQKHGATKKEQPASREVTLRESYYITAVPEQILEIVVQAVDDADSLTSSPAETYGPIKPAGEGLYSLPGLILSMYRACAPNAYMRDPSGNMFLYNDSLYLAEQLRAFADHHARKTASSALGIAADIASLETFGKASYGKEMEAQRTIVRDLLDGAQGFAHCTEAPFAEACELAVSSTTERLTQLHAQWSDVLAPSALQQSLGSLLATVTNKMLVDVEELSDISEPESQRLVAFCQRIELLERLFLPAEERDIPEDADSEQNEQLAARAAMAASVYSPGLLKFQWLSQILEGALADIKFWWTESELALAFAPEEVVDLIEALFADSDHRRRAIAEIRRGR
jgi:protein transport protein DSL1/ZW10